MDSLRKVTYNEDLDSCIGPLFNSNLGPCPYIIPSRKNSNFYDSKCKHYADFSSIHADLFQALSLIEQFQSKRLSRKKNKAIKETLWKYAVVLLGRTFTKGDSRNVNLQSQYFTELTDSLKQTLNYFLHLRHKFIAHQGDSDNEYHETFIVLNPGETKEIVGLEYLKLHTVSPSGKQVESFKELLNYLLDWTEEKIEKLKEQILTEFNCLDIEKIYAESEIPE